MIFTRAIFWIAQAINQKLRCRFADFAQRLTDSGELWHCHLRDGRIVKANHRKLARHLDFEFARRFKNSQSNLVIACANRGWPVAISQKLTRLLGGERAIEMRSLNPIFAQLDTMLFKAAKKPARRGA